MRVGRAEAWWGCLATTRREAASSPPWLGSIRLGGARPRVTGTGPRHPHQAPARPPRMTAREVGAPCPGLGTWGQGQATDEARGQRGGEGLFDSGDRVGVVCGGGGGVSVFDGAQRV